MTNDQPCTHPFTRPFSVSEPEVLLCTRCLTIVAAPHDRNMR